MIRYGQQQITAEDIEAVVQVLQSDFLTQGPAGPAFEQALQKQTGAQHVISCSNGTAALHLACMALDLGSGDYLWTSPISFVASANCALYCNAGVDFVDIDPDTFNISVAALEEKLAEAESTGRLPKVLVAVHLCGLPCDMEAIHKLSQRYGFKIIEDASHAVGASYKNTPVGNCQYSDMTVFSFHPVKIITTAEGGAVLTNQSQLADRLSMLRSHGITREPRAMTEEPHGDWYYQQVALGYNYRLTDIQAALGLSQLTRLEQFVSRRGAIAERYLQLLEGLPVSTQVQSDDRQSSHHLFVIRLDLGRSRRGHKAVFDTLRSAGIGVNLHYIPIHTQPWYRELGFVDNDFPQAMRYYAEAISLPIYPDLRDDQLQLITSALEKAVAPQ
jgi:UDP-4-amino-4,6-dideoxy-N-acetyl-beta-L-altrosamine transaminase